jgi:hypothetical protein
VTDWSQDGWEALLLGGLPKCLSAGLELEVQLSEVAIAFRSVDRNAEAAGARLYCF